MPQYSVELSIIIPIYNEADRISATLRRINQYMADAPLSYELILALDGPSDNTLEMLEEIADEIVNLRIINRTINRGKGYSVREAILQANGRLRLFVDADNSTDIAHFEKMRPLFAAGYAVVIASRSPKDVRGARQSVPQPWYKRAIGQAGNWLVQLLVFPGVWDTQCGFKAFHADAAAQIFSRATIDGWGFDIEVLTIARALNYSVGIIPAEWTNDRRSHVRLPDYLRILRETLRVRRNLRTGKYR
jgi:dolichyl-phosphate beta-glucosyltransferase